FLYTWRDIRESIKNVSDCRFNLIKSYSDKTDYGDMDILIEYEDEEDFNIKLSNIILSLLPQEISNNNKVVSMNYDDLQVDFIFVPKENYDICYHFFAFNDLGGFMGKIARSMKLKYGQNGLEFTIFSTDKSRKLETVNISKDPKEIIEFLGFDYYKFV